MDGLLNYLSPDQQKMMREQALTQGLLGLGSALLQGATGAPGQGRPRLGQVLGQAIPAGLQSYQGGMDQALREIVTGQQLQEAQRKRQQEAAQQQALQSYIQTLPEDQRARFAAFPTQAAEASFREPKAAPGVIGEYRAALEGGEIPPTTTLPQYIEMKKPPAPSATAIAGGPGNEFMKKVAEAEAKDFVTIKQSGQQAQRASRDINRLDTLLSKVETGGAAAFKQAAGNIGINTEGLSDIQAAQAIINKLVPAQRPPGSGTMSDADLALYKESLPRIINQPGANKEIIRSMKEINDYLVKEGQIAAEVTAGRITPEEGTRRIFALGNPVQEFFDRTQQAAPRGPVRPTPQDQSLILKYLNPGR